MKTVKVNSLYPDTSIQAEKKLESLLTFRWLFPVNAVERSKAAIVRSSCLLELSFAVTFNWKKCIIVVAMAAQAGQTAGQ